jgi:hypothetical protein
MFSQAMQPYVTQMLSRMFGMFANFGQPPGMMPPQPGMMPSGHPTQFQTGPASGQTPGLSSQDNQISKKEMEEAFRDE